jgi:uncharacterized membrane protein
VNQEVNQNGKKTSRLGYLDWTRGLGAVIMLQGHVFHSFTAKNLREDSPFILSQFAGGMPPAIFLFLTGVTLAFLMDSSSRKEMTAFERVKTSLSRSRYLFLLAFAFRFQLWVFGLPHSRLSDLLRVDILNAMGLGIAIMSLMAVFTTAERVRLCAILGLGIAAASPLATALDWNAAPALAKAYFAPDPNTFSFFPWASFLAFGVSTGSILRLIKPEQTERMMQWAAMAGFGLILGAQYFANLPYSLYGNSQFWLDSPALILIKLGVIFLMLSFGYVWHRYVVKESWSWVCQLGTASLLVYWVHTELVYGFWFYPWKENLTNAQTVVMAVFVIVLMVGLSWIRANWERVMEMVRRQRSEGFSAPERLM